MWSDGGGKTGAAPKRQLLQSPPGWFGGAAKQLVSCGMLTIWQVSGYKALRKVGLGGLGVLKRPKRRADMWPAAKRGFSVIVLLWRPGKAGKSTEKC